MIKKTSYQLAMERWDLRRGSDELQPKKSHILSEILESLKILTVTSIKREFARRGQKIQEDI